jgi:hypothetical protein
MLIFYVLLFWAVHLAWYDFAMDPTKEEHPIVCRSREMCNGDHSNDCTRVWGRKHEPCTESPNWPRPKKAKQLKSKVRSNFGGYKVKEKLHMGYSNKNVEYRCSIATFPRPFKIKSTGRCVLRNTYSSLNVVYSYWTKIFVIWLDGQH